MASLFLPNPVPDTFAPDALMRNSLCLLLLLTLSGCASWSTDERLERVEAQIQNQQILDLRLAHVEDRLTEIESSLGEIRSTVESGTAKDGKKVAPRRVEPAPARPVASAASGTPAGSGAPALTVQVGAPVQSATSVASGAPTAPVVPAAVPGGNPPASSVAESVPLPGAMSGIGLTPWYVGEQYQLMPGGKRVSPGGAASPAPVVSTSSSSSSSSSSAAAAAPLAQPVVSASSAPMMQPASDVSTMQLTSAAPAPSASKAQAPSTVTPAATGDKGAYNAALALYDKNQLAAAEQRFSAFLQEYPQSPLVPNAMYWLGECYYSTGKMDSAIMIFKDVAGRFPRHPKAAAALLKAGYAYAKLNDMENAQFYWQILIDDFPDSAPAALARKRMAAS